jgi:hypothetical protein
MRVLQMLWLFGVLHAVQQATSHPTLFGLPGKAACDAHPTRGAPQLDK